MPTPLPEQPHTEGGVPRQEGDTGVHAEQGVDARVPEERGARTVPPCSSACPGVINPCMLQASPGALLAHWTAVCLSLREL